jgi:uncharacterized protein DUF6498
MSSAARLARRPPSLAAHWRDLKRRPNAWVVIARNLVPVVGIFAFGWSRSLVIFSFWFDGLMGLVAILTAIVPRAIRETPEARTNVAKLVASAVLVWAVLVAFICLPYWIALIPLHDYVLDPEMWRQIRYSPGLWATFGAVVVSQLVTAFRKGYGTLPEPEMKQALRWDAYLLVLKGVGMFVLGMHLPVWWLVVPAVVLLGTYLELWPANALGAVWGDPRRLFEDPEDAASGPPRPTPPWHEKRAARERRREKGHAPADLPGSKAGQPLVGKPRLGKGGRGRR